MFFIEKSMEKAVGIWYSNSIEGQALPISKYIEAARFTNEQESIPVLQDLGVPFGTGDTFHLCWMSGDACRPRTNRPRTNRSRRYGSYGV